MKLNTSLFLLALVLSATMTSCVDAGYAGNGNGYGNGAYTNSNSYGSRSGFNTYSTLPRNYSGSAYLYNNRYYSGGQYQTGRYNNQGRNYDSRYYYNGQYYYGGSHAHYPGDGHDHGSLPPRQYNSYNSSYQGR